MMTMENESNVSQELEYVKCLKYFKNLVRVVQKFHYKNKIICFSFVRFCFKFVITVLKGHPLTSFKMFSLIQ